MIDVTKVSRYDVLDKIAESSFSVVYRGQDSVSKRPVAIKICIAPDAAFRSRFLYLAEAAAPLRHPNIVEILEFGSGDGKPYLIEEFLPGSDLGAMIDRGDLVEGVPELELLAEIARGLEYAHQKGVLHQDLKPATVHLESGGRVKLVDFGLARLATAAAKLHQPGKTPKADGYLPPEQALGLPADERTDIYCFGALAYELVAKLPPFPRLRPDQSLAPSTRVEPEPLISFWPECPATFAVLVRRCLALSPGDRYASFTELRAELQAVIKSLRGTVSTVTESLRPAAASAAATTRLSSSLDDTMAIPPDLPAPANKDQAKARDADDTRETTLPAAASIAAVTVPVIPAIDEVLMPVAALPGAAKAPPAVPPAVPAISPVPITTAAPALAQPPKPAPAAAAAPLRPLPRKNPAFLLGSGLAALVLLAVVVWLVRSARDPGPSTEPHDERPSAVPAATVPATGATPPAGAAGSLIVDATPWGQVTRIVDGQGREAPLPAQRTTPLVLQLAPGRYTVEVSYPPGKRAGRCEVELTLQASSRCQVDLGRVSANQYFKDADWWR